MSNDDAYLSRLQELTSRVNQVNKQKVITTPQYKPSIETVNSTVLSKVTKHPLQKYQIYTYIAGPLVALILFFVKPKFILKEPESKKNKNVSIPKLIGVLVLVTAVVYGINFGLNKFIFT
jgi:hypothetical protein